MDNAHPAAPAARRDFIVRSAAAYLGVGAALALWPFIDHMNPNPATPPPKAREVDLQAIAPGETRLVWWRTNPIAVRNRTFEEVQRARSTPASELVDRLARNANLPVNAPASDANRTHQGHANWLVVVGLCTHMGCLLTSRPAASATGEGWFCPCHASRFDLSGRVRSGPARRNLSVPPYRFLTPTRIRIG